MSSLTEGLPRPLRWMYTVGKPSWDSLQTNAEHIDVISPNFYWLTAQGTISGGNQPEVTNFAQSKGIKVIPMIQNNQSEAPDTNFNPNLANPAKVRSLIDTITQQVKENNYDGYQIDFESLNAASELLLTNFMRELHKSLNPLGKLVTIALVARTAESKAAHKLAYNYAALAPFVDLAIIMTYDFAWPGGPPGAVAPLPVQEQVMNYSKAAFGPDKVLLGVPFYGYDWNVTGRKTNPALRAESRAYDEVTNLQRQHGGTVSYDEATQSPFLDYQEGGQQHKVWFENPRSLTAKFEMMKRLDVRGFAAWRLGHEGSDFWPLIGGLSEPTQPMQFAETGHSLQGAFKEFWEKNGGLAQFGFPISDEVEESGLKVQYFERAKFEFHPQNPTGQTVLLTLLGRLVTTGREAQRPFQRVIEPLQSDSLKYYAETGHTLRGAFKEHWEKKGGLALYGFPISEEFQETNADDGKSYTVQYFERARFEFHPELSGPGSKVLLGLLGRQVWQSNANR